jgi:hypothetical protein
MEIKNRNQKRGAGEVKELSGRERNDPETASSHAINLESA